MDALFRPDSESLAGSIGFNNVFLRRMSTSYRFYLIKSKKSEEIHHGLRQISLACSGHPMIKIFLWVTQRDEPRHIQLFFEEKLLDWHQDKGLHLMETNRRHHPMMELGLRKGSRTLSDIDEAQVFEEALSILKNAEIPAPYDDQIRLRMLASNKPYHHPEIYGHH